MRRNHTRALFFGIVGLAFVWGLYGGEVLAQNRTSVSLTFEGEEEDLRRRVEKGMSKLLTELNRASYFKDRPDLTDQPVTEAGKRSLLQHWNRVRFRCPKTTLSRSLVATDQEESYVLRSIPLMVESDSGASEERTGILRLDARGRLDGFMYKSERDVEPETGTITLRTKPADAAVVSAVGRGTRRRSPATFEEVPADVYAFTIRKDGYRPIVDTAFVVRPNREVERTVRLTPKTGRLAVSALPSGAILEVDGDETTLRSGGVEVGAGSHTVAVSKQHFTSWDTTITVSSGDTTLVRPRLRRKQTPFIARSSPDGATVLVNEEPWGRTPIDTTLDAGRSYVLQLKKDRHVPSPTFRVVTPPDSVVDRRVVLSPVELRTTVDEAKFADVQVQRVEGGVDLLYGLVGETGESYTVTLDVVGPDGAAVEADSANAKGALGAELSPGGEKRISWRGDLPEGAKLELALEEAGGGNRLLYVIGGVVAAGGGTLAAVLFGGGGDGDGGGTTFPPPPGLPE